MPWAEACLPPAPQQQPPLMSSCPEKGLQSPTGQAGVLPAGPASVFLVGAYLDEHPPLSGSLTWFPVRCCGYGVY